MKILVYQKKKKKKIGIFKPIVYVSEFVGKDFFRLDVFEAALCFFNCLILGADYKK